MSGFCYTIIARGKGKHKKGKIKKMTMMELIGMMMQAEMNGDASVDFYGGMLHFTIEDFDGFDDDWSEIEHDFTDGDLVDTITDALDEMADEVTGDYYIQYHFGDAVVQVGSTSMDI